MDTSAFQEVSLGREASIIFTSYGPLIYRWNGNYGEPERSIRIAGGSADALKETANKSQLS